MRGGGPCRAKVVNTSPMRSRTPFWRMLALAATYVVVLQTLLLPLSVVAASPFRTQLCAEMADSKSTPAHTGGTCACASGCGMQCCDPAVSNPPSTATAIDRVVAGVLLPPAALEPFAVETGRGPQNPRAPPVS